MTSESRKFEITDKSLEGTGSRPPSKAQDLTQTLHGDSHSITEIGSPLNRLEKAWKETAKGWEQEKKTRGGRYENNAEHSNIKAILTEPTLIPKYSTISILYKNDYIEQLSGAQVIAAINKLSDTEHGGKNRAISVELERAVRTDLEIIFNSIDATGVTYDFAMDKRL